jgi:hypothetical protein
MEKVIVVEKSISPKRSFTNRISRDGRFVWEMIEYVQIIEYIRKAAILGEYRVSQREKQKSYHQHDGQNILIW